MIKKLLTMIVMLTMSMTILSQEIKFVYVNTEGLNVRKAPNQQAPKLIGYTDNVEGIYTSLYWEGGKKFDLTNMESFVFHPSKGEICMVLERKGEWTKVRFDLDESCNEGATDGWVSSQFLKNAEPVTITRQQFIKEFVTKEYSEYNGKMKQNGKYQDLILATGAIDIIDNKGSLMKFSDGKLLTLAPIPFYIQADESVNGIRFQEDKDDDGEIVSKTLLYGKRYMEDYRLDFNRLTDNDIERIIAEIKPIEGKALNYKLFFPNINAGKNQYEDSYKTFTVRDHNPELTRFHLSVKTVQKKMNANKVKVNFTADYPTDNDVLSNSVRTFINQVMGDNHKGNLKDGQIVVNANASAAFKELSSMRGRTECFKEVSCNVFDEDEHQVTYAVNFSMYAGGAHGIEESYAISFRKSDGTTLDDILQNTESAGFKRILAEAIKRHFEMYNFDGDMNNKRMSDAELLESLSMMSSINDIPLPETSPAINNTTLTLYYKHYEIAPYAAGNITANIPLKQLRPYLKKEIADWYLPKEEVSQTISKQPSETGKNTISTKPAESTTKPAETKVEEEEEEEDTRVFSIVEQMPEFPGGTAALIAWIHKNMKYPSAARENGIQGRVVVTFVIDKTGSVTHAQISRSVDPSLDREALRLVQSLPKWKPGKQNGEFVNTRYSVPITFRL